MIDYQYSRASDVADAVRQMTGNPSAKFIAGGTNLVDLMKMDVERPTKLIDVSKLPLDKAIAGPQQARKVDLLSHISVASSRGMRPRLRRSRGLPARDPRAPVPGLAGSRRSRRCRR